MGLKLQEKGNNKEKKTRITARKQRNIRRNKHIVEEEKNVKKKAEKLRLGNES